MEAEKQRYYHWTIMDPKKHDPLDQEAEENELETEAIERETDSDEVQSAEEAAINIDTEVAREATEHTAETDEDEEIKAALEEDVVAVEAELANRKHKNRESTSEKAKKAAAAREAQGLAAQPTRQLDPLRLRGKKYRTKVALLDQKREYPITEAVELLKQTSYSKFDGAVEMHCKVKSDNVRGIITFPHSVGKVRKVAVADEETIEAIAAGKLDFDVLLATPAQMPKLAKHAKLLGPKGLMPSPKAGTVTEDIAKVKEEITAGRMEYRSDKNGVVHVVIGRVSSPVEQIVENFQALEQLLVSAKIQSLFISATMGPGIKVAWGK